MKQAAEWIRNGLAVLGVLGIGFWLGAGRTVNASSYNAGHAGVQFQMTSVDPSSSLLVYEPEMHTVYVYRGAMEGNSYLQCTYKFVMDHPGGPIQRIGCEIPKLTP
jgi:hypothetical protein